MKKGTTSRASKLLLALTVVTAFATSATFATTLISLAPRDTGDNLMPVNGSIDHASPGGGNVILAPNTENDWVGVATGNISTTTNWSLGHVPTSTEDAVFNASSNGTGIRHLDNATAAFGSIDVTATTGTFTIRNATAGTTSTITLGGANDNSVAPSGVDLLYAASGSTLNLTGTNGTAILNLILAESGNFDAAGTIDVSTNISGAFGITKTGAGILALSGTNSYGGGLTLNAGTLRFNSATAAGSGTFTINGGTLTNTSGAAITASNAVTIGGDFTFAGTTGTNNMTLSGPATLTGDRSINVSGATSTLEISGSIGGAFALTKSGPGVGTLILSGSNTYSGGTNISSGTLIATANGAFGTGGVNLNAANVTLTLQGGTNPNFINDAATLTIGFASDIVNLNYTGTEVVGGLIVAGTSVGPGTYSSTDFSEFAGAGTITVVPEPTTVAMTLFGASLLVGVQRFRRRNVR